jgi:hypothetical protein
MSNSSDVCQVLGARVRRLPLAKSGTTLELAAEKRDPFGL